MLEIPISAFIKQRSRALLCPDPLLYRKGIATER